MLVTWHPVPGTGLEPVWLPFCSKVQAPGIAKAFSKGVPSPGGTIGGIRNSNVTRHSNGASPSVWGRVNRSTTTYTAGPLGGRLMVAKDSESTDTDLIQPLSASGSAYGVATFPSRFQRLVSRFLRSPPHLPIPAPERETRNGPHPQRHFPSINPCPHRHTTAPEPPYRTQCPAIPPTHFPPQSPRPSPRLQKHPRITTARLYRSTRAGFSKPTASNWRTSSTKERHPSERPIFLTHRGCIRTAASIHVEKVF